MSTYDSVMARLRREPKNWTVTGAAGFVGSHLVEALLRAGQHVVGLDDFSTGKRNNLEDCAKRVGPESWQRFRLVAGDVRDPSACRDAVLGATYVLHQAARTSVPRSMAEPEKTYSVNVKGFAQVLSAARACGVRRTVYASSSSVYGDDPSLPKVESRTGMPLSPYAATKAENERQAQQYADETGQQVVGLRYFNVFGPRQAANGAYAAVIPRWIQALRSGNSCTIFGDGTATRDFSHISNIVQANLLAATSMHPSLGCDVLNVATGGRTSLGQLHALLCRQVQQRRASGRGGGEPGPPIYAAPRPGDIQHSIADVSKARSLLDYQVVCSVNDGLEQTVDWFVAA